MFKQDTSTHMIGVDLDGTLAYYNGFIAPYHIGEPISPMVERVKGWLAEGKKICIYTSRVAPGLSTDPKIEEENIKKWCLTHLGQELPVTCIKTNNIREFYDDRAWRVVKNTGEVIT